MYNVYRFKRINYSRISEFLFSRTNSRKVRRFVCSFSSARCTKKNRFDDGWISQQERNSLNDLARCDNRELLGHVTERYAQFVHSHDVSEFVTNLRAVLMTSEFP